MCGGIVRKIIRFPFMNDQGIALAAPGLNPSNTTGGFITDATYALADPLGVSWDGTAQRVSVPRQSGLRAISIASDSAIASCNISYGGPGDDQARAHVSVGQPFIGNFGEHDYAQINVPSSPPLFDALQTGVFMFDAIPVAINPTTAMWTVPLRLNFWYGDALPVHGDVRAPLRARARVAFAGAASRSMVVCVDGRRRVAVIFKASAVGNTISVDEVVPTQVGGAEPFTLIRRVAAASPGAGTTTRWDIGGMIQSTPTNTLAMGPISYLIVNVNDPGPSATTMQIEVQGSD
jgi:hypothetical protein